MALVFKLPDSRVDVFQKRDVTHFPEDDHLKNLTIDITVPSFGWCKEDNSPVHTLIKYYASTSRGSYNYWKLKESNVTTY